MLARPAPERLTDFYLRFSVGGVMGGILSVLVPPPLVCSSVIEYPHTCTAVTARSGPTTDQTCSAWCAGRR